MKIKSSKFLLAGVLTTVLLARNLVDSQFATSFFFAIVAWQSYRAAFTLTGFESEQEREGLRASAARRVYGPLVSVAWCIPYAVLVVGVVIGISRPALRMPMVWLFLAVILMHSVCELIIWRMMVQKKREQA